MAHYGKHARRISYSEWVMNAVAYMIAWPAAMIVKTWRWFWETRPRQFLLAFIAAVLFFQLVSLPNNHFYFFFQNCE